MAALVAAIHERDSEQCSWGRRNKSGDDETWIGVSMRSFRRFVAAASIAILAVAAGPSRAADVAGFYKGRTVQVLIGFSAGGGYDIYARTLARYMGKHIPGNPTMVPQNMPGAGTLKVANYIYNVAPKDGTVIGTFARGIPMEKLLGRTVGQQFDATKFTWIGSVTDEPSVCVFWAASGIKTWADMKTKPWKVGGSGVTSDLDIYANVLRNMFHLPGRLITGFPGGTEVLLSMQRREVDGRCGWSWSSLISRDKRFLDDKLITVPLQLGLDKNADIPDVPLVIDQTSDPKEKAALKLIFSRQVMARPFAAPPNLPPDRAKALRDAFDATMKDPAFLAEMKKLDLEVRPQSGVKVEQLVKEVYSYPPDVVKIAADAIRSAR
jgi:tripartite-type tricarboxylate transporter receptor subunit TctC